MGEGIVLSGMRRRDRDLELRVVNETSSVRTALVGGPFRRAIDSDLLGRLGAELAVVPGVSGT